MQLELHTWFAGLARQAWLVALITVGVCSALAARAVAGLGDVTNDLPPDRPHIAVRAHLAARVVRPHDNGSVLARNMFCSSCAPGIHRPCVPTLLLATSMGTDPRATLRVIKSDVQGSWGLHETVPGVGRLDRIGRMSVDLVDPTGHTITLSLLDPATGSSCTGAATPGAEPVADDPWRDRVSKVDDHTYEVDRTLVRDLVTGAARPGAMRMIPITDHGEIQGVRMYGVTRGSIANAIGLRSGDQLVAIDGEAIKNAQQLLDFYARLDQLTVVELSGIRAGKPLQITLHLR